MILITGATGAVGRPLVEFLAGQGAEVRAGDVARYVYAASEESLIDERDLVEVAPRVPMPSGSRTTSPPSRTDLLIGTAGSPWKRRANPYGRPLH
ncbi:NAD-dependent epimerase/dehydratase family protein [Planotetraspora sp. GP83]|uniref:NAD-dependent epimerase/dehydratase family protein n=1 Tax=Planotetraspora sp. GP83 TaxID=3156264 RepID=UPI0035182BB0